MYTLSDLQAQIRTGSQFKTIFFWSERKAPVTAPDKGCFSQWYPAPLVVDDIRYLTAEHYMMAEKARLFGASELVAKIIEAPHPGAAKQLGRMVPDFNERVWIDNRFEIVVRGNRAKYSQNDALGAFLRGSKPRVLAEASPRDQIWGIGLAEDHPDAADPLKWRGENLLGFALMQVRDELLETA
jgi:ribA/ribD-fused uncharacterized protein